MNVCLEIELNKFETNFLKDFIMTQYGIHGNDLWEGIKSEYHSELKNVSYLFAMERKYDCQVRDGIAYLRTNLI